MPLDMGYLFWWDLLSAIVEQQVVILEFSQEKMSAHPSTPSMNSMKRQKDRTLTEELPRSAGAQYATGGQWRNNSRENERMEPKQKQCPVVDVTGDGSKV